MARRPRQLIDRQRLAELLARRTGLQPNSRVIQRALDNDRVQGLTERAEAAAWEMFAEAVTQRRPNEYLLEDPPAPFQRPNLVGTHRRRLFQRPLFLNGPEVLRWANFHDVEADEIGGYRVLMFWSTALYGDSNAPRPADPADFEGDNDEERVEHFQATVDWATEEALELESTIGLADGAARSPEPCTAISRLRSLISHPYRGHWLWRDMQGIQCGTRPPELSAAMRDSAVDAMISFFFGVNLVSEVHYHCGLEIDLPRWAFIGPQRAFLVLSNHTD